LHIRSEIEIEFARGDLILLMTSCFITSHGLTPMALIKGVLKQLWRAIPFKKDGLVRKYSR